MKNGAPKTIDLQRLEVDPVLVNQVYPRGTKRANIYEYGLKAPMVLEQGIITCSSIDCNGGGAVSKSTKTRAARSCGLDLRMVFRLHCLRGAEGAWMYVSYRGSSYSSTMEGLLE
ncbi:hypothetical protein QCA50_000467 [Cerrena zonata]|uniref:Uncharacterized protein n=1 Tax=Cerrena zonata TaxID=2478898 RepID=A0AAW0H023_9APHY